jgi:tetratricopeptide (TPR) repeat protein
MARKQLKAENSSKAEDAATDALFVLHPDLSRLVRAIRRSTPGQFALYLARCNMPAYRSRLVAALKTRATKPIAEISLAGLPLLNQTLDDALLSRLRKAPDDAVLFVYDLDSLLPHHHPGQQEAVLLQLNWRRSAFARLQRTLVFWLPEHALQLLHSQAPDFADWYSGIYEFDVPDNAKSEAVKNSLQGFYTGDVHAAKRLNAEEKKRWIEVLHNLLEDGLPPEERGGLWNDLGCVYQSIGYYDQALNAFQEAYALSWETKLKTLAGVTLNNISQIFKTRGDYETALKYLQQSLAIRQEIGDKSGNGATLNNISNIYYTHGDYETALKYLQQSLAIFQEIGHKSGEGTTLNNISQIFMERGDTETALKYLQQSLAVSQEIGDKSGEGTTLNNISQIFKVRGDTEAALKHLQQSLAISQEIGDKSGEGTTLNNISQIYSARGDTETALKYLQQSLAISQEIGDKSGLCATRFNMGLIFWQNNQQDEALQQWVEVYRVAKKIQLAQALQVLEKLANDLELPGGGLDAWEVLAREQDAVHPDAAMRDNEESDVR